MAKKKTCRTKWILEQNVESLRPKWTKEMMTTNKRKAQNALRSMRRRFTGWADFRLRSKKVCK